MSEVKLDWQKRVERLEETLGSEARFWKRVCFGLLATVGILFSIAASYRQDTLEAKALVLRDDDGKTRAALRLRKDGSPGLAFFDRQGMVRLSLDMSDGDLPSFNLYDPGGRVQAALAVRPEGTPGLALFSDDGDLRASLDLGHDGSSGVNVYGKSGVLRAAVAVRADGTPAVGLFDERGKIARSWETN